MPPVLEYKFRDPRFFIYNAPPPAEVTLYLAATDLILKALRDYGVPAGSVLFKTMGDAEDESHRVVKEWGGIPIVVLMRVPLVVLAPTAHHAAVIDMIRQTQKSFELTAPIASAYIKDVKVVESPSIPHFKMMKALPPVGGSSWWEHAPVTVWYPAPDNARISEALQNGIKPGGVFYRDLSDAYLVSPAGFTALYESRAYMFEPDQDAMQAWAVDSMFKVWNQRRREAPGYTTYDASLEVSEWYQGVVNGVGPVQAAIDVTGRVRNREIIPPHLLVRGDA